VKQLKWVLRLGSAGLVFALAASAQTLQQAEDLWKARRYKDANEVFRQLVAKNPKNADLKVRWGRMYLEHWQPAEAGELFGEALELDEKHSGALLGMALIAAESYEGKAADLAKKALEIAPKLVEAQELLARLALEDNDNPKAVEEAKKALAIDPNSVPAKAVLATMPPRTH
jgi:cellulose synthase operon protein C